jgi:hypothetical protein
VRRTLLTLAISACVVVSGCSAITGGGGGNGGPVPRSLCEQNVAAGAQAVEGPARITALDAAIRTCRSLEQWTAAVVGFGAAAVGPDAITYLSTRCADSAAGVGGYQLCGLLAASRVTHKPGPTHKPKKTAKPKRTPKPVAVVASPPAPVSPVAPVPPGSAAAQASQLPVGSPVH